MSPGYFMRLRDVSKLVHLQVTWLDTYRWLLLLLEPYERILVKIFVWPDHGLLSSAS